MKDYKEVTMQDYSHIPDSDYNSVVQDVRQRLCSITNLSEKYTTILCKVAGVFL